MQWKIVLEGTDEFGSAHRSELTIDKDLERLSAGEIGFSVEDGKAIMAHLQQVVVNQQCEAYVLTSRFCTDCEGFRRIKDYSKRKIRTVFGCVEVQKSADPELPALSTSFLRRLDSPARYLPGSGDAGIDGAFGATRQPLAVSQSGGGDGRVPADQTNRVLCDPAPPHAEAGRAPRREGS